MALTDEEFAKQRKNLLEEMLKHADPRKVVTKVIYFTNNDVPEFLKRLEKAEQESRKSKRMIGEYSAVPFYK